MIPLHPINDNGAQLKKSRIWILLNRSLCTAKTFFNRPPALTANNTITAALSCDREDIRKIYLCSTLFMYRVYSLRTSGLRSIFHHSPLLSGTSFHIERSGGKVWMGRGQEVLKKKRKYILLNRWVLLIFLKIFFLFFKGLFYGHALGRPLQFYAEQCFSLDIFLKHSLCKSCAWRRNKAQKGFLWGRRTIILSETVGHYTSAVIVCSCALILTPFFYAHTLYLLFIFSSWCPPPPPVSLGPFKLITSRVSRVVSLNVRQPFRYGFPANTH